MSAPPVLKPEDRTLLAGFHKTVSEQLNARLAESPKFFGVLLVISTGFGYVLWTADIERHPGQQIVVALAALLSYMAILWASAYLAALGYAFRFLQNCQHCIEHVLAWDDVVLTGKLGVENGRERPGRPPKRDEETLWNAFWLLPGIYHAHAAGMGFFLAIVVGAFCWHAAKNYPRWPVACVIATGAIFLFGGLRFIWWVNRYHLRRYTKRRLDPDSITSGLAATDSQ